MTETLSDTLRQVDRDDGLAFYKEEDVKEFIKKLKDEIELNAKARGKSSELKDCIAKTFIQMQEDKERQFFKAIDKLAGPKLT